METTNKRTSYQEDPLQVKSVRLPFWHIQKAKKLGEGNLSKGIRKAIDRADKETK